MFIFKYIQYKNTLRKLTSKNKHTLIKRLLNTVQENS